MGTQPVLINVPTPSSPRRSALNFINPSVQELLWELPSMREEVTTATYFEEEGQAGPKLANVNILKEPVIVCCSIPIPPPENRDLPGHRRMLKRLVLQLVEVVWWPGRGSTKQVWNTISADIQKLNHSILCMGSLGPINLSCQKLPALQLHESTLEVEYSA